MSSITETGDDRGSMRDAVLEIRDVNVTYDMARGRARVLDDVSVEIERGETFAVVGESGSGKSTFGSVLMNAVEEPGITHGSVLYYPEEGSEPIDILGLSGGGLRRVRWEEISMVSQAATNSFNPTISVRRHFEDTFDAHGINVADGLAKTRDILSDLNLDPDRILGSYQHELSGGEKQRAMLGLSLVFEPEVLILDEPTAGLDLLVQRNILSMLYDIKDEYDLTLIFITHDMPIVSGFADRIAIMYAFEFVEFGTAREVLLAPEHPYTRLMLQSNIDPGMSLDDIGTIDGETPDPINVPTGCSFHPRCPIAQDRCEVEDPRLRGEAGSEHRVACFFPDQAVAEIPAPISRSEGKQ